MTVRTPPPLPVAGRPRTELRTPMTGRTPPPLPVGGRPRTELRRAAARTRSGGPPTMTAAPAKHAPKGTAAEHVPLAYTCSVAELRLRCEALENQHPKTTGASPLQAARQRLAWAKLQNRRLGGGSQVAGCCNDMDVMALVGGSVVTSEKPRDRLRRERLLQELEDRGAELVFVRQIFDIFDADRDGKLNQAECQRYLEAIGANEDDYEPCLQCCVWRDDYRTRFPRTGFDWVRFCETIGCTSDGVSSLQFECDFYGRETRPGYRLLYERKGHARVDLARCQPSCCERLEQKKWRLKKQWSCFYRALNDNEQLWCRIPAAVVCFLCFSFMLMLVGGVLWADGTSHNDGSKDGSSDKFVDDRLVATKQIGWLYFLYSMPLVALSLCCTFQTRCGCRKWKWHHHWIFLTSCVYCVGMIVVGVVTVTGGLESAVEPCVEPLPLCGCVLSDVSSCFLVQYSWAGWVCICIGLIPWCCICVVQGFHQFMIIALQHEESSLEREAVGWCENYYPLCAILWPL